LATRNFALGDICLGSSDNPEYSITSAREKLEIDHPDNFL